MNTVINKDNKKWLVFTAACLVLIMTNIDYTAVNLALAPISNDLHAHLSTLQWIINGYSTAGAGCALIGGRLGDIYGYRKTFIWGVIIFTVTSILIGLSFNQWEIIVLRIIQGGGAAICWPLCVVIISNAFPKEQQGRVLGMSMAIASISLAAGPIFAGVLLHFVSWRWIFFINFPLGILAIGLASYFISSSQNKILTPLHLPSVFLVLLGLLSITTALNEGQQWGLSSSLFHLFLWGGIILTIIFLMMQKNINNPLLNLKLLQSSTLNIGLILRIFNQILLVSVLFTFSLLLQNILGYTPLVCSLILSSLIIAMSIAAFVGGKFVDSYGSRPLIFIGMTFALMGSLLLTQAIVYTNLWSLIFSLIIIGVGLGVNIPSLITTILKSASSDTLGTVGGLNYVSVFLGGGIATIMSGWILHQQSISTIEKLMGQLPNITPQAANLKSILSGARSIQTMITDSTLTSWIQQSFIHSCLMIMGVCAMIAALSLLLTAKIKISR